MKKPPTDSTELNEEAKPFTGVTPYVAPKDTSSPEQSSAPGAANHLSANMGANLKTSNEPQVISGGTASSVTPSSASKKRKGGGLSSQLGINV